MNRGISELRLTIPAGSAQEALKRGIPLLRNTSTEEFLTSGVPRHSRVVSIQGWFLAGSKHNLFALHPPPRNHYKIIPSTLSLVIIFVIITKSFHPELFLCSVAAKELLCKVTFVIFAKCIAPKHLFCKELFFVRILPAMHGLVCSTDWGENFLPDFWSLAQCSCHSF